MRFRCLDFTMHTVKLNENGFVGFSLTKQGLRLECIINDGFYDGVKKSENYHFHSSYEVHVAVKGGLHILVEEKDVYLEAGDVAILPPGAVHYVFADGDAFRVSYRYKTAPAATGALYTLFQTACDTIKDVCVLKNTKVYETYLLPAAENYKSGKPSFCVAELLFLATYELVAAVTDLPVQTETVADTLLAENIEEFFNSAYNEEISLGTLATFLHFSTRHTERVLDKLFGMSFGEMLTKKRLAAARLLLRTEETAIGDIAARVGFANAEYFNRKFTASFGVSPRRYREMCKEQRV